MAVRSPGYALCVAALAGLHRRRVLVIRTRVSDDCTAFCIDSQSGCGIRKASPQPRITGLLESGKHAFDHVVWIPASAQEFELKHCALDLTGPAYPGGVGVLLYGVVD